MNALRGHSNIQGLTDLGLMSNLIPGYLTMPTEREATLDTYMSTRGFKPLRPNQMSYWQNYKKFFVSFQKSMWGEAATRGEQLRLRLAAQARRAGLRRAACLRADAPGQDERLLLPGLQPAAVVPEPQEAHRGAVEAQVPRRHGSAARPRRRGSGRITASTTTSIPSKIQTEVIELPTHLLCRGRRARSSTPAAGCNGTGPAARRRARPRATSGSWRRSICA